MTTAPPLVFRRARMDDAALLLAWRNDEATRQASIETGLVSLDEHVRWLAGSLASPDRNIQIAEADGQPVGVVRADRSADGWELSWTVNPGVRGRGVGRRMLRQIADTLDGRLTAVIRTGNVASASMATAAGFSRTKSTDGSDFESWLRGAR